MNDAHGRHDVPVALPTTANAGDCHVDGSCCVLGPPASRNHAPVRDYRAETSRTPCDRSCKNARDVKDEDKAHVGAWDGDETAQNVAERPR